MRHIYNLLVGLGVLAAFTLTVLTIVLFFAIMLGEGAALVALLFLAVVGLASVYQYRPDEIIV